MCVRYNVIFSKHIEEYKLGINDPVTFISRNFVK